nr:DNA-directed DNA polymerase [Tanacetum cinerariifolium]
MRVPNVPSSSIKLMLFPFSLEGAAQIWLEPPRSIQTWDDLVSKFINQFFPPLKTTNLCNEITRFQQRFDESFYEAWERFNDLLRACPHHEFFELHQLDTFYNALNVNDQDSLNSAADGNFLDKIPRECLKIIESKSKVRQSRAKAVVAKVGTSSSTQAISSDVVEFKDMVKALLLDKKNQSPAPTPSTTPAPVKAVEPNCNKEKLCEMARTTMNEHCSAVILNNLPRKLGDPEKFLIPCEFSIMDECLALADLGASLNFMPLSVWEGLSLPEHTPTCMTLELADRSVSKPIGIAKYVSFKFGVFHFPANFVVVDFEPDPQVPLILGRCFLKTSRALIDVHKGELTLRIANEAITYNLDQTVRYSANYNQMTANKIDFIESACEEYSQEGDILLLEAILNSEPSPPLRNQEQNLPSFKEKLKAYEAQTVKSSVDEPPEVELKDLPHHLRYVFLEGDNKLLVIIAKELRKFCKYKILMEEDYKPTVQNQRRVNPKIHDVIKKEVKKLLDAGLIYPISDSPWVSPVYCVPKKGGFTVVENEENKLILTRFVTGWRVGIDYRKLNEATRKDHFPFPFMDQMLERLAENEYYCFLDSFFGCMLAVFHDMVEKTMEVFMDDFSVFGNSFENCLSRLDKMLQRCEDTNLSVNWEKSHFMVKEGIVLGHKISKNGIEVDRAKVDVIAKLPHPTTFN